LEAAEEVFDQNPLATLDDVARAAGLSRMTIYRHFKTREELLETLTIEGFKGAIENCEIFDPHIAYPENLKRLTVEFLKSASLWRAIALHPRNSRTIQSLRSKFLSEINEIVEIGTREGFLDADVKTEWKRISYLGLVSQAKKREKELKMNQDELAALIVRTYLSGLRQN
jgi:AcrR family transcriptional regulator